MLESTLGFQEQHLAALQAEDILKVIGWDRVPIEPLEIAKRQGSSLRFAGEDFGTQFDGQLEYHKEKKRFLLFFNNKYDEVCPEGHQHPRTRFSVAHELAHYFLDHHRRLLLRGRRPHKSRSEFRSEIQVEREADAFAAALLMPSFLLKPRLTRAPITRARLEQIARDFNMSLVGTTIRCVQHSDFPCGVIGIRNGAVAWTIASPPLIAAGIYPRKRGSALPASGAAAWHRFLDRSLDKTSAEVRASQWFQIFGDEFADVWANEEFISVRALDTLMVLVTVAEDDLMVDEQDEYDDELDE